MKPKVLIIENSIDVTGALKSITKVAHDLNSFLDFEFVIPQGSKGRHWIEKNGFQVSMELPMKELSRRFSSWVVYLPYLLINAMRLRRWVKRNGISLIHVNDLYNLLPVVIRLSGIKIPYLCHIRFLPDRFPPVLFQFWLKLHFRYVEKMIAVSESVRRQLPNHPKLVVIYNELPPDEKYGIPPEKDASKQDCHFLYLSNFMVGKGQDFALLAFARIHQAIPGWKMRFIGSDMGLKKNAEYLVSLKQQAARLKIEKKVEWGGFTIDVEKEYKQSEIVLNFSESESFSITCMESLFYGRPLIATDCGGPAEIIDQQETGILVPNRNIDAMAGAMLELSTDIKKRRKLASTARETIRKKFSIEKTSYKILEYYRLVLSDQK